MKIEKFLFTPSSSITTVILNDSSLEPSRVLLWVESPYPSHGYDDMTRQVASYGTSSIKNDRSIYMHNGSSAVISGRVTDFDIGEFTITFDNYAAYQISGLAIED